MVYKTLEHTNHLLILAAAVSGCDPISAVASLVGIPIGIASSAATRQVCIITTEIKHFKSIIQKKKNKHAKIVL